MYKRNEKKQRSSKDLLQAYATCKPFRLCKLRATKIEVDLGGALDEYGFCMRCALDEHDVCMTLTKFTSGTYFFLGKCSAI